MIKGINHITISVSDLERSFNFYTQVLGFKPLLRQPKGAYLLAGDTWFCLEIGKQTRAEPSPDYTHFAFTVDAENFEKMSEKIKNSGAVIWKNNKSEGDSIYLLDPDDYKLEVHVGGWETRIAAYKKRTDLQDFQYFV